MQHVLVASDQLDGVMTAAIVARWLRLHGKDWKVGAIIGRSDIDPLEKLSTIKGALIYLLDLQPSMLSEDAIRKIMQGNRIAYWCSDTPTSKAMIGTLGTTPIPSDLSVARSGLCCAELAAKRLLPSDATAQTLTSLARDIKLWRRSDEQATRLADIAASGYDPKKLIDMLSKGVVWSDSLELIRKEYLERKGRALDELDRHFIVKDYVGVKFGFSLAAVLLQSADACQRLLDSYPIDVACIIFRDGRIAFRRKDGVDIDLEQVAVVFGGGGREFASGGRIKGVTSVSGENVEHVMFAVDRNLKDFFLR